MPGFSFRSRLYVVCDLDACGRASWTLVDFASACLDGGASLLQIRAKSAPARWLLEQTEAIVARAGTNADVIVTDDGYEGLLLIGERKPQMVILDLKMPKIDGYQVLELLRARKKDNTMKVVVLSAFVDNQIRERLARE